MFFTTPKISDCGDKWLLSINTDDTKAILIPNIWIDMVVKFQLQLHFEAVYHNEPVS